MSRNELFLTGGTGFVGSHVLRALLEEGYRVRALVRRPTAELPGDGRCRAIVGDLARPGELAREMRGCRYLVHVAGLYSFAPRHRPVMWRTNVAGTRGLLEAARLAGVERAVVTSSSAAVGPARPGQPATEETPPTHGRPSAYHASKLAAERAALAARVPVVVVLPTAPVGSNDWRPTPTGRIVLDYMRGRMFASLDGGMNLVGVGDVARAHVRALERGRLRERYLVGGQNLTFDQMWRMLSELTGRPRPRVRLPRRAALGLAWADEARCRLAGADPVVPLEGVRMAAHLMHVDDAKARRELGHRPSPVVLALAEAVGWYRRHGYA